MATFYASFWDSTLFIPLIAFRADFRFRFLHCNDASHWLGASLESTLFNGNLITNIFIFPPQKHHDNSFYTIMAAAISALIFFVLGSCLGTFIHKSVARRKVCTAGLIVLFCNYFLPSGEQPIQRILTHKSEQSTTGCIATFHKYCCYLKRGGIITNLNLWNPWRYITDMSKCHSAGVWSMD